MELADADVPRTRLLNNRHESGEVALKEPAAQWPHQEQPFARLVISLQRLNYFHAIKVANAGERFKGLLV